MEVKRFTVTNWRGLKQVSVRLTPGLNIVWGPNESGKSSLREALWAAFALPPRPRGRSVIPDVRPWDLPKAVPTVEVYFRHAGSEWRLKKVFAKSGSELERDGRLVAKDDTVQPTLSSEFAEAGVSSLWCPQGEIGMVNVAPELRPLLAASEAVSPGASWLETEVDTLFGAYWTDRHERPKKLLQQARDGVADARREVAQIEELLAETHSIGARTETLDQEQRRLEVALQKASLALGSARNRLKVEMRKERDRAACDAAEQRLANDESWLTRWRELLSLVRQTVEQQQAQEDENLRISAELGDPPDRTDIERLRIRHAFAEQRLRLLLHEELQRLRAPTSEELATLTSLSQDLRSLLAIEGEVHEILPLRKQLDTLAARERDAAQDFGYAETQRQEATATATQSLREAEERLRTCLTTIPSLQRASEVWRQLRLQALETKLEVEAHEETMRRLKSEIAAEPARESILTLQRQLAYCSGRLHALLKKELLQIEVRDTDAVTRLKEVVNELAELQGSAKSTHRPATASAFLKGASLSAGTGLIAGAAALVFGVELAPAFSITATISIVAALVWMGMLHRSHSPYSAHHPERRRLQSERDRLLRLLGAETLEDLEGRIARADQLRKRVSSAGVADADILPLRNTLPRAEVFDRFTLPELESEIRSLTEALEAAEAAWSSTQLRRSSLQLQVEETLRQSPAARLELIRERANNLLTSSLEHPDLMPASPSGLWWEELRDGHLRDPFSSQAESARNALAMARLQLEHARRTETSETDRSAARLAAAKERWQEAKAALHNMQGKLAQRCEAVARVITENRSIFSSQDLFERLRSISSAGVPAMGTALGDLREYKRLVSHKLETALNQCSSESIDDARTRYELARSLATRLGERPASTVSPEDRELLADWGVEIEAMTTEELQAELCGLPERIQQAEEEWRRASSDYAKARARYDDRLKRNLTLRISAYLDELRGLAKERPALGIEVPDESQSFAIRTFAEIAHTQTLSAEVERQRAELSQRRAALGLDEVAALPPIEREVSAREAEVAELRDRLNGVSRDLQQSIGRLRDHRELFGRLVRAREALAERFAEQRRLELESRAARLLRDALREAKSLLESDIVGPLRDRIGTRLAQLTEGRYISVHLSDAFDAESLRTQDDRQPSAQNVSFGTQEQLGFLSRLSLGELLSERERHLVIFDDQLVHTDSRRLKVAFDLLTDAAKKVQVLLLTCHPERFRALKGRAEFSRIGGG